MGIRKFGCNSTYMPYQNNVPTSKLQCQAQSWKSHPTSACANVHIRCLIPPICTSFNLTIGGASGSTCLAGAALTLVAFEVLLDVAAEEESVPALRPAFANGDSALASGVSGPFAQLIASARAARPTLLHDNADHESVREAMMSLKLVAVLCITIQGRRPGRTLALQTLVCRGLAR